MAPSRQRCCVTISSRNILHQVECRAGNFRMFRWKSSFCLRLRKGGVQICIRRFSRTKRKSFCILRTSDSLLLQFVCFGSLLPRYNAMGLAETWMDSSIYSRNDGLWKRQRSREYFSWTNRIAFDYQAVHSVTDRVWDSCNYGRMVVILTFFRTLLKG